MSARKTFEDYYYEKIYDKVEERKSDLVRRWRAGEKLPLIKVSGQKNTEDEWLEALSVRCTANGEITDIVEFSNEPIYVVLRTQKGKRCSAKRFAWSISDCMSWPIKAQRFDATRILKCTTMIK